MKTFNEFVGNQALRTKLAEAATLMVEKNVQPEEFLLEYYRQIDPEIALYLQENLWSGVKAFGQQALSGIRNAGAGFARNAFGPQVKFDSAMKSLTDLVTQLQSDEQLKGWVGSRDGRSLVQQVGNIVKLLGSLKAAIPQNQFTAGQNQWGRQNGNQQQQQVPANVQQTIPHPATQTQAPPQPQPGHVHGGYYS